MVAAWGPSFLTPRIAAPAYAASISQSVANIDQVNIDLTGDLALDFTGGVAGQQIVIRLKQDATGSRLLTLGSMFRLGTSIASTTLTTTALKTDYLTVVYNAAASKYDVIAFVKGY